MRAHFCMLTLALFHVCCMPIPALAQQVGEAATVRPPENSSPEERRAFWQKRAAEREAQGEPGTAASAAHPPESASPEERRAFWQRRAAERESRGEGNVAAPAPRPPVTASPEERQAFRQTRAAITQTGAADAGGARHVYAASPGKAVEGAPGGSGAGRWGGAAGGGRDGVLWLTDAPAQRSGRPGGWRGSGQGGAGGQGGRHGGHAGMAASEGGKDAVPSKRVWLRAGSNPLTARPAIGEESALMQGPDGKTIEIKVEPHGGPYNVKFATPNQGYYNVYFIRRALDADVLNVSAAKVEVTPSRMSHGMDKDEAARLSVPRTEAQAPVEIIRARKEKEGVMGRINYGDTLTFQVVRAGKPVQNARVTFSSGQGWSNSAQSDEDGRASFTLIRDYYPQDWSLFDKRHRETYLVSASFATPEAGEYQGGKYASIRFTASLSGAYYPGIADYESYSDGLLVGVAGLIFTGTSVWWFRRRRVKPYKEVQFDD